MVYLTLKVKESSIVGEISQVGKLRFNILGLVDGIVERDHVWDLNRW
jgi:hypothetical protein